MVQSNTLIFSRPRLSCKLIKSCLSCNLIVLPLFLFLFLISNGSQAALNITDRSNKINDFSIEYLYDDNSSMTIEEVAKTPFSHEISNQFALGYWPGAAWFKITIHNQSLNNQFILYFTELFWTTLDLYTYNEEQWVISKNGLRASLSTRDIQDVNPSFPIQISPQHTATYYIRGTTVSSHIGEFQLLTHKEFYKPGRIKIPDAFNIYSGILFFTMLLTSLLYFVMGERLYLYYTGYVFAFILWVSTQSGFYLYIGLPGWPEALHSIGALFVFFLVLFSKELLELKKHAPLIAKLFNFSAIIVIICSVSIALKIPYINLFFNIFSSLFFMLLLAVAIRAWIHNYFTGARYYLIALVLYMPTMALMTLTYNGLIPNTDPTRYAFTAGSFIEILFFSFILANRFVEVKSQKLLIQKELLQEKDTHSQHLNSEVAMRTHDLQDANIQLLQQTRELEEAKKLLSMEASTDTLTTLTNRRYFLKEAMSFFNQAKELKQPISILMIDIDRFKGINDTFGHAIGDKAIIACAQCFKTHAKSTDIVSRYGGEEFVILSPQSTLDRALELAEHIRKDTESHPIFSIDGRNIFLTISIGVTQIDTVHDNNIEDTLKRADKALYMAKEKGRNNVISL